MPVTPEEAAQIEAVAALSNKVGEVLDFSDISLCLQALVDTAAAIISDLDDPETARNQFVAALDGTLDLLTFMPQELRR